MAEQLGRILMVLGLVLAGTGLVIWAVARCLPLGQLPGDLQMQRDRVTVHLPIGTLVVVSLLLTLILNLVLWLRR